MLRPSLSITSPAVLARRTGGAAPAFTPASLFGASEHGGWYDPSDLGSMFQDSAGTISAAVNLPVGRINDKSGGARHLTQAVAASRPVLRNDGVHNYLEFDGVDDVLFRTGAGLYAAGVATVIIALKGNSQTVRAIFGEGNSASGQPFYNIWSGSTVGTSAYWQIRTDAGIVVLNDSGAHVMTGVFDGVAKIYSMDDSGTVSRARVNRGAWGSKSYTRSATSFDRTALGGIVRSGSLLPKTMSVYQVVAIARQLTAAELSDTEAYLAARSGVALA